MATQIPEPASTNPDTAEWQALLSKLTLVAGGLSLARLTNWDTTLEPQVAAGSRFEVNGAYYSVAVNEAISGWASVSAGVVYVYATPSGASASFSYSATAPTYDAAKGGWYNGTARALFRIVKESSSSWAKKALMASVGRASELQDEIDARAAAVSAEAAARASAISTEASARSNADAAEAAARIAERDFGAVGSLSWIIYEPGDALGYTLPGDARDSTFLYYASFTNYAGTLALRKETAVRPTGTWRNIGGRCNNAGASLWVRVS